MQYHNGNCLKLGYYNTMLANLLACCCCCCCSSVMLGNSIASPQKNASTRELRAYQMALSVVIHNSHKHTHDNRPTDRPNEAMNVTM